MLQLERSVVDVEVSQEKIATIDGLFEYQDLPLFRYSRLFHVIASAYWSCIPVHPNRTSAHWSIGVSDWEIGYAPFSIRMNNLVHRTTVDGIFELLSSITVALRYTIEEVSPVTHLVEKCYTREKHMTTKRGQPEISVGVLLEFIHNVIVNFDLGAITSAAESRWYTTLAVIQIGDNYQRFGVPHQRASSLR